MGKKMYCAYCGKELTSNVKFCPYCGEKVLSQEDEAQVVQDDIKVKEKDERKMEISFIDLLDKIPDRPPLRKRIMWGFIFIAFIFLLTGYFVTALVCALAGILLHDRIYDKANGIKKGFLLIGVFLCFCVGIISFEIKELDNKYISTVQEASFNAYPNEEIGLAFKKFFREPEWTYFVSDEGMDIVEFTGKCKYDGVEVDVLMQFTVDEDGTFEVTYLSYNEVSQNLLELASLIGAIFNDYN